MCLVLIQGLTQFLFGSFPIEFRRFFYSMDLPDGEQRSTGPMFYKIGLSFKDADQSLPENNSFTQNLYENKNPLWKLRKLNSISKEFNHDHRIVDILKIDVEGSEVLALEQALEDGFLRNNVKQILVEWHLWNASIKHDQVALRKIFDVYNRLFQTGFKLFFRGKNDKRKLSRGVFPFTCLVNSKFVKSEVSSEGFLYF